MKSSTAQDLKQLEQDVDALVPKRGPKRKRPDVAENNKNKTGTHKIPKVLPTGLSIEQEAYCRARALGMGKAESVKMAGLKNVNNATQWEKLPAVQERIQELIEIATQNSIIKTGLDRGWVISRLMTVTERCMQAEPVMVRDDDGSMVPSGEYKFDSSGANKALELLGRTLRMFDGKDKEQDNEYANLSDDDIARIAAELATETGLIAHIAGAEAPQRPQQVVEVQAIRKTG